MAIEENVHNKAKDRTPHHLSFDITGAPLELALAAAFKTPIFGNKKGAGGGLSINMSAD